MIRQASWAMEQVRKNEQNKLSRGLRRYFKRSKHLLRKPMEALSSEEQERQQDERDVDEDRHIADLKMEHMLDDGRDARQAVFTATMGSMP